MKEAWKDTGKGLGFAFRDLGKTLIRTAKVGVEKADEWANSEDKKQENKPEAEAPAESDAGTGEE